MLRVGLCSKTPRGRTGRARSVKRGGAHLQYIYNRFQKVSGRSVENPRTSSLHKNFAYDGRTDGRTDGRKDGHHLELRTFNFTKSRFDTHRYHLRWKQKMHGRTGQNLYGPLTIVRRAIIMSKIYIFFSTRYRAYKARYHTVNHLIPCQQLA